MNIAQAQWLLAALAMIQRDNERSRSRFHSSDLELGSHQDGARHGMGTPHILQNTCMPEQGFDQIGPSINLDFLQTQNVSVKLQKLWDNE